jgi:hypothetical protein
MTSMARRQKYLSMEKKKKNISEYKHYTNKLGQNGAYFKL